MPSTAGVMVGIDIGGTFTDFVMYAPDSGAFQLHKLLTTPHNPTEGVMTGLRQLLSRADAPAQEISLIIHGTTLITNALIERKGAVTALLTTAGHRDVLETGTQNRYDPYNLFMERPVPLVPRQLRLGVNERLSNDGREVRALDLDHLACIVDQLKAHQVESVAICFLHSFRNSEHELAAAAFLAEHAPGLNVSLSSQVAPEIREFQRMSTTVCNAYVRPLAAEYLAHLKDELHALGYQHPLQLMLSSGGITSVEVAARYPIHLLESGPAAGVLFASVLGQLLKRSDLISFDMGGTTAKMCYIADGQPSRARSYEVARVARFKPGSGLPVQVPVIELLEIGTGGGSIAYKDALGLLKVGPQSAGADPGPACYGLGGTQPTVTDANLLLGYLSAENFLGGEFTLHPELAEAAIRRGVAEPLGLDVIDAARGIFDIVNQNMVAATKVHVAEKGQDPRRAALVAFGGAGPIHAHAIARDLRLPEVICPLRAGAASALGFLTAPIAFDFARSLAVQLDQLSPELLAEVLAGMEATGYATLAEAGTRREAVYFKRSVDMRHVGQGHEIEVPLPPGTVDADYVAAIPQQFYDAYKKLYGQAHTDVPIEVITCRVTASGPDSPLELPVIESDPDSVQKALRGRRPVHFREAGGFVDTPVYDRYSLRADARLEGPAIVEERESTVVMPPRSHGLVDRYGNLILRFD